MISPPAPRYWRGLSAALCFTGLLVAVSAAAATVSAETRLTWREWASTNLDNLEHHPVAAIVVSPFLPDGYPVLWIGLSFLGLAAAGRSLGGARTALLAAAAHVLATLLSQGVLAARIAAGEVPDQARHILDVGPSYVAVGALVAAIAYGTWPARLLAAGGFAVVAPYLFTGLEDWELGESGHACAVVIGLALGYALHRSRVPVAATTP